MDRREYKYDNIDILRYTPFTKRRKEKKPEKRDHMKLSYSISFVCANPRFDCDGKLDGLDLISKEALRLHDQSESRAEASWALFSAL